MLKRIAACALLTSFAYGSSAQAATLAKADYYHSPDSEMKCIADNVYWESRNQVMKGMIAVALVTRNRVADKRFPHSYCEVIHQGPTRASWKDPFVRIPLRDRCHFSWYCDGKSDDIPDYDIHVHELARAIAFKIYNGEFNDFTEGSTHYHADYVTPEWSATKTKTITIGDHIFYRWEN